MSRVTIGLISDTHGLLRPEALAALEGCDRLIHAGDVGNPRVWVARFDETQSVVEPDLVRNPDDVTPPDPFLSADDIARRGAAALAEALASTR
jgi:hypothetical protein